MDRVGWARDLARRLLAEPLPRRWSHVQGVGRKAESIAHIVSGDATLLICAAWLHDIGYAPSLFSTGLHSLDGARYLRDIDNAEDKLCRLVANHSCAAIEARNRGLADSLLNEFPAVNGLLAQALTYCDMTTTPDGGETDVTSRLDEIHTRYGDGSLIGQSMREARPEILRADETIRSILANASH